MNLRNILIAIVVASVMVGSVSSTKNDATAEVVN